MPDNTLPGHETYLAANSTYTVLAKRVQSAFDKSKIGKIKADIQLKIARLRTSLDESIGQLEAAEKYGSSSEAEPSLTGFVERTRETLGYANNELLGTYFPNLLNNVEFNDNSAAGEPRTVAAKMKGYYESKVHEMVAILYHNLAYAHFLSGKKDETKSAIRELNEHISRNPFLEQRLAALREESKVLERWSA